MPANDKPIRIVKRTRREVLADPGTPHVSVKTESETQRELLKTIKSWIAEQRETKKVLDRRTLSQNVAGGG